MAGFDMEFVQSDIGWMYQRLAQSVRPRPVTRVSDWADQYRILSSKGSSEPGRWKTSRTPYLREIMDCLSVTSPVQRVVMMFSSQIGKTEAGLNWLGYITEHAPAPTLVVLPTLEVRKRWVRQRLNPLLRETPVLSEIIDAYASRDAANSEDIKEFPGGFMVISGANSPASLASMPIRNVLLDEVDRFPWEVGEEGDPIGLIDERTKAFPRRKLLMVSTPTVKGGSRIELEYNQSDMREYHVPCPHCGEYQVLRWKHADGSYGLIHVKATGDVFYACRECGARIDEHHKPEMLAKGRWIARHPERKVRGYHLNGLYSPIGLGFTWREIWQQWEASQGDTASLKRFINTTLGETWEEQGETIDDMALITRLEDYGDNAPWLYVTAGVDVQKDRLEVTIDGWSHGEENWTIDHLIIPGDTALQDVWDALEDELSEYHINLACIDSGYNTSMVYSFCENRSWAIPVKGVTGMGRPLVEDERRRRQRLRRRRKKGNPVEPLGVDQGKALLYARLKIIEPGPQYIHFSRTPAFDDEYFAQLAAEKLVTKVRGGRPFQEWVQTRARNEALDCKVYSLAALRLGNPDFTLLERQRKSKKTSAQKPVAVSNPSQDSGFGSEDWAL